MTAPAARVGDITASGDAITGPGAATVLIGGQPASVAGDTVSGAACTGALTPTNASLTVLIAGRPAARVGTQVVGVNPATGAPVTTVVGPPGCLTVLIGG